MTNESALLGLLARQEQTIYALQAQVDTLQAENEVLCQENERLTEHA